MLAYVGIFLYLCSCKGIRLNNYKAIDIMANESVIKLFEGKKVRIVWDEEQEKYYFSVADIVQVLTDTVNPTDYIKKMKVRDKELAKGWGQIVTPLSYQTLGGKQKINFANLSGIFRIIQSVPSKKSEPIV